jgi:hypothetical protein
MHNQWAHHQNAALRNRAFDGGSCIGKKTDGLIRQNPVAVRPRQDPKRTVVRGRVIEMNPQCDNFVQCPCRCVRIVDPGFHRPGAPAGSFKALFQREGRVLMPGNEPVCILSFLEQSRPERSWRRAKRIPRDGYDSWVPCHQLYFGNREKMTGAGSAARNGGSGEVCNQTVAFSGTERLGNNLKPPFREFCGYHPSSLPIIDRLREYPPVRKLG